ncbi:hypothetical protein RR46_12614 [Papilio xuthus]|uniref:Uncharacterized protein n=1 Tax=Papilio xuthus TaxID=66420 RepID=A0A194PV07_PAPXU|nr:hypothetical protein RR46_12614 [Papilio xuthus]
MASFQGFKIVDVNLDLQIKDIFSDSFDNNLYYDFTHSKIDQNNSFGNNKVETKHELNTGDGQNCNNLSYNSKTAQIYSIEENKDLITSNKYKLEQVRDQYLENVDSQLRTDENFDTEFNMLTDLQASSDNFTDSGCFASQSTIEDDKNVLEKAIDMPPKECMKNCNLTNENYINPINEFHMDVDETEDGNFENEFKYAGLDDSNCSGYHSSDFEFIEENEAREVVFNITKLDADIVNISYCVNNKEVTPNSTENRSKSFSNCQNHFVPEGDDFLILFQTAPALNYERSFIQHNCYNFVPSLSRSRLGFEVEKFEEYTQYNKVDVRAAKETVKNILSMYPRQNKYYKGIL